MSFILGIWFILWGLWEKGSDLLGVRGLVLLPNVVPAVLELYNSAKHQGFDEGHSFGFGGEVITVGKGRGCCHASNMRTSQRGRKRIVRLFCVERD